MHYQSFFFTIEECGDDIIFYYYFQLVFNNFEDICKYELLIKTMLLALT